MEHVLQLAASAGISERRARAVAEEVRASVDRWEVFASEAAVSDEGTRLVKEAFYTLE